MSDVLRELTKAGVSVWLDDISRDRLRSGNLETLIRDFQVRGVTSNPTIFAHALSKGSAYDEQSRDLALRGVCVEEAARMITTYDIRWACDVLRPVYEETGGLDGRVSIEVDPRLAKDTARTIAEARQLWWLVDRPNLFIKIPATREGLPAITAALAQGISVNVTLIFSLRRYGEVIDAYMAGLEQAAANGHELGQIASVASFFVSRVDTEVDKRLDKIGTPEAQALRGKAAVAVHVHQGPGVPGHDVRRRPRRQGHREHDAGGDPARHGRPRRAARRHRARHVRPGPRALRRPGAGRRRL